LLPDLVGNYIGSRLQSLQTLLYDGGALLEGGAANGIERSIDRSSFV